MTIRKHLTITPPEKLAGTRCLQRPLQESATNLSPGLVLCKLQSAQAGVFVPPQIDLPSMEMKIESRARTWQNIQMRGFSAADASLRL
jgi:hypothetical protein